MTDADLPMMREWLSRPHVAEWWGDDADDFDIGEASVSAYVAEVDGRAIGFIQSYDVMGSGDGWWPDERDPGARGIDQFIAAPEDCNRGLGTAMIGAFIDDVLFSDPAVTAVQTDPSPSNARAIRCYEKCGFRAIGEVVTPDGPALLMKLRREERALRS